MKEVLRFTLSALLLLAILAQEAPLKITVEKIDIEYYNKDYLKDMTVDLFQYNSTYQALNGSGVLLKDLGMHLIENVDVFGVEDGKEVIISTAKDISVCEILGGGFPEIEDLFKFGNFTKCPMKAGLYVAHNAILDTSKIPPSIPKGEFRLLIKAYDGETHLSSTKIYIKVDDMPNIQ